MDRRGGIVRRYGCVDIIGNQVAIQNYLGVLGRFELVGDKKAIRRLAW